MLKKITLISTVCIGILASPTEGHLVQPASSIAIDHPWVRISTGPNTAAYCTLTNTGSDPDKLMRVECMDTTTVELHNHVEEDGVMKMRPVSFIEIGASPVTLKPGSLHIMLMGLKDSFQGKKNISMTLYFQKAGPLQIDFPVKLKS